RLLLARRVERLLDFIRKAFAVSGLVVDDGDILVSEVGGQIFAGDAALLIIAAAHAIDVRSGAVVGEGGISGGRRDRHHVGLSIAFGSWDRRAGAVMASDQRHIVAGHLVRDGYRLFRVTSVVADLEIELFAEHAARFVDVLDRHLAAVGHLRPEGGILTRDRADAGNRRGVAFVASAAANDKDGLSKGCDQPGHALHYQSPLCKDPEPTLHQFAHTTPQSLKPAARAR